MTPYKLVTKTIKPVYKVLSKVLLDAETAKKHPYYSKSAWEKHPSYRLHVKINQSIDKIYNVSIIDEDYEEVITRNIIVKRENFVDSSGDVVHIDPVTPFVRFQEVGLSNKLAEVVFQTKDLNPKYGIFVEDVVKFLRSSCNGTNVNQHLFITLEFKIEEVYVCHEGVDDNW